MLARKRARTMRQADTGFRAVEVEFRLHVGRPGSDEAARRRNFRRLGWRVLFTQGYCGQECRASWVGPAN